MWYKHFRISWNAISMIEWNCRFFLARFPSAMILKWFSIFVKLVWNLRWWPVALLFLLFERLPILNGLFFRILSTDLYIWDRHFKNGIIFFYSYKNRWCVCVCLCIGDDVPSDCHHSVHFWELFKCVPSTQKPFDLCGIWLSNNVYREWADLSVVLHFMHKFHIQKLITGIFNILKVFVFMCE